MPYNAQFLEQLLDLIRLLIESKLISRIQPINLVEPDI